MNALASNLVRWRGVPVVLTLYMTIFVRVGEPERWTSFVFFTALALSIVGIALNLAGFDPDARKLGDRLVPGPLGGTLVTRWVKRSRYARFVGGAVGFILGFGLAVYVNRIETLALLGLAGVAVGGALAEIHVLRRVKSGPRVVDLTRRRFSDYVGRLDLVLIVTTALCALILSTTAFIIDGFGAAALWPAAGLLVMAVVVAVQHRVTMRPRPSLGPELLAADDLLRHLAATRAFARPSVALGLGLTAYGISLLDQSHGGPLVDPTWVGIATVALWIAAGLVFMTNRRLGINRIQPIGVSAAR